MLWTIVLISVCSQWRLAVKLTRKIIFAILIGLSLLGAASATVSAAHVSAATAIEY
jgi:hypothetical protein